MAKFTLTKITNSKYKKLTILNDLNNNYNLFFCFKVITLKDVIKHLNVSIKEQ